MPSAWHVQRDLLLELAAANDQSAEAVLDGSDDDAPFAWFARTYGERPTYDRLLDALTHTPVQRLNMLKPRFTASPEDQETGNKQPTAAHLAIADLVKRGHVKIIVTLNFDHLIEEGLRRAGVDPIVVNTEAGIAGLQPLHEYDCLVVHLHGDYTHPEMRNVPEELGRYPDSVQSLLRRLTDEYGLIISGWSAQWDPALRDAIDASRSRRYPIYWASPTPLADEGAALAERKSAVYIQSGADEFFPALRDKVFAI